MDKQALLLLVASSLLVAGAGLHEAVAAEETQRRLDQAATVQGGEAADAEVPPGAASNRGSTPQQDQLRDKLRRCLDTYFRRSLNAADLSPWEVMHMALGYGVDTQLLERGRRVNALGWLCWNGSCRGQRMLEIRQGSVQAQNGPGVQGHDGQFLSILALSRVPLDYQLRVAGRQFTVGDLVAEEKRTCVARSELTFKLIGLVHYLDSDETWKAADALAWSIPRLLREEMEQPVVGAACGGTHRMMGFGYAVRKRAQRGEPFEGQWQRARQYVQDFHAHTFKLQNPDGSFSSNWFAGRGDWGPAARRLQTTGHTLEWLILSLTAEQLLDPRVTKAVEYVADLLLAQRQRKWGPGPLGHALHALTMYDERVYGAKPGTRQQTLDTAQLTLVD